jgi:DNA primase
MDSPFIGLIRQYVDRGKVNNTGNYVACCPFHDDKHPSFSINTVTGDWICFGCGLRGNIRYFLRLVNLPQGKIDEIVGAASPLIREYKKKLKERDENRFIKKDPFLGQFIISDAVAGIFYYAPTGLINSGFSPPLLKELEIGYDPVMERIMYPIRDLYGNLTGYSGRATKIDDFPRYKVYTGGCQFSSGWVHGDYGRTFDIEYPNYIIHSKNYLWNAHRIYKEYIYNSNSPLIVVEGFKACIWLIQHGFLNTVALMGSYLSKTQRDIIFRFGTETILMLDNDPAGIKATKLIGKILTSALKVTVAQLPDWAHQPDDLNKNGIDFVLENKRSYQKWKERNKIILEEVCKAQRGSRHKPEIGLDRSGVQAESINQKFL